MMMQPVDTYAFFQFLAVQKKGPFAMVINAI